jgi:tetratricopeptide (TPR) repeat protein
MHRRVLFLVIIALLGLVGRGWCGDELPVAAASPPPPPPSFENLVRQYVKGLGYPDRVSADLLRMVRPWGCVSWKQRLERVRREFQRQETSATALNHAEEDVAGLLYQTVGKEIAQAAGDNSDYFYLSKVVADKKAQCLGSCQLLYILGNSIGLQVRAIDVSMVSSGRLPIGAGHATCLVSLTSGQVMLMDASQGILSRPFTLEEEYRLVGNYYELQRKGNPLGLHPRIRIIDANALIGMIYYNLASKYAEACQFDQFFHLAEKAIALDPKFAKSYVKRAAAHFMIKQYAEAVADCNTAIGLDPILSEAYEARGDARRELEQYPEAIADHTKAIELNPENYRAYSGRSNTRFHMGQYAEALADCTRAIELKPQISESYRARGAVYFGSGQYAKAMPDYDKAIELSAENGQAYADRGVTHLRLDQHAEAIADCSKAIELNPKSPDAYCTRGDARSHLGQYREAISDYTKALELTPNDSKAHRSRGVVYALLGSTNEARRDLRRARQLDPTSTEEIRGISEKFNLGL